MTSMRSLFDDFNGNITDIKQMYYLCKDFINKHENKEREEKIKHKIQYDEKLDNANFNKNMIKNEQNKQLTSDDIKWYERKYKYINYQIEKHIQFYIKKIKIEIVYSGDTEANGTYQLIIDTIEICDESKELKSEEIIQIINNDLDDDDRCELNYILNENNINMDDLFKFIHQILHHL